MGLVQAVQEAAQPWVPRFVPQEIALETVKCPLRKKLRIRCLDNGLQQHGRRLLSSGAHPDAMCGGTKAAATTQAVKREGPGPVGGRITSQVPILKSKSEIKDTF